MKKSIQPNQDEGTPTLNGSDKLGSTNHYKCVFEVEVEAVDDKTATRMFESKKRKLSRTWGVKAVSIGEVREI